MFILSNYYFRIFFKTVACLVEFDAVVSSESLSKLALTRLKCLSAGKSQGIAISLLSSV